MAQTYKIKEVNIQLASGVIVTAEVDSIQQLKELIDDLQKEKLLQLKPITKIAEEKPNGLKEFKAAEFSGNGNNPLSLIEEKAELPENTLTTKKILGIKDGNPQILRPSAFTSQEGIFVLLYALEYGLGKQKISFDEFKTLYDGQGIKSGSPLVMTVNNLKNNNYIDKKIYEASRELTLNARGATKAIEVLKSK